MSKFKFEIRFLEVCFLSIICLNIYGQTQPSEVVKKPNSRIEFVDIEIMTFAAVPCNEFHSYFDEIKFLYLNAEQELKLNQILENLEVDDSIQIVDVRAILSLDQNNEIVRICIGFNSIDYNNKIYASGAELVSFISNLNKTN